MSVLLLLLLLIGSARPKLDRRAADEEEEEDEGMVIGEARTSNKPKAHKVPVTLFFQGRNPSIELNLSELLNERSLRFD